VSGPDVSVVIPTRDRRDQLAFALRSVLAQRDVELEVVLVDDASTDGVDAMISGLDEPRVRVLRNTTTLGETATRNRGIEAATGRWVAFLDDDDLWSPDKVSRQLDALTRSGRGWAYAGDVAVDAGLTVLYGAPPPSPDELARTLVRYNSVPSGASNVIVRSDLLQRVGPFDASLRRTGDWDMWLRLLTTGPAAWVPEPLVANRIHPGNVSRDMKPLFRELTTIAARHGIDVDMARHYRWAAWAAAIERRRVDAVRCYARAALAGDLSSLGRAAIALAGRPDRLRRPSAAARRDVEWCDRARSWLRAFGDPAAG
jgi:glycosyltransferase involved in cell wall biosynthesis